MPWGLPLGGGSPANANSWSRASCRATPFAAHRLIPMFEKIEQIIEKHQTLEMRLSDPALLKDRKKFEQTAREHKELSQVVQAYGEWRGYEDAIEEAKVLLEDGDPEMSELAQAELEDAGAKLQDVEKRLRRLLLPRDPNDEKNVILEVRAGTGGQEAALFAANLYRMYVRYAEVQGWKAEELSKNESDLGGLKEVSALIKGAGAYSRLRYESGTHRVQKGARHRDAGQNPHLRRHGGRAARSGRDCAQHRGEGFADRRLSLLRSGRPEREHDGFRRSHHPFAHRLGRHLPGREEPA